MGQLYDAASGETVTRAVAGERRQAEVPVPPAPPQPAPPPPPGPAPPPPPQPAARAQPAGADAAGDAAAAAQPATAQPGLAERPAPEQSAPEQPAPPRAGGDDVDGARLVALNMALNGESRADTDRYLAENFELADRPKLIDEVYAAIEA
jgi:hypothetical protein